MIGDGLDRMGVLLKPRSRNSWPLFLNTSQTESVAELSYLVGDDSDGMAAVFYPPANVKCHLELARAKNVPITHIFETPIHADFCERCEGTLDKGRPTAV